MEELGKKLLEERVKRGISLIEISNSTHIAISVLKDIEAGNFEKYKGDEQYIKMYLKKYANYLKIDATQYIDTYVSLTRELNLKDIEEVTEEHKKTTKTVRPQVTLSKPNYTPTRKVYENRVELKYLKYLIIAVMVIFIIVSVWYGIKLSQSKGSDFSELSNTHISGETNQVTQEGQNTQEENQVEEVQISKIEITRNSEYNYNVVIPNDIETFTLRFEFGSKTWSQLKVNDKVYEQFETRVYNTTSNNTVDAKPEVVELTFNKEEVETIVLRNGNNLYHHYYFNDQEVDLSQENPQPNATNITFNIIKE